tara:strand:- start:5612 stop:6445 length:834 start_codon:yes stop_codon:yes gene_type:complete
MKIKKYLLITTLLPLFLNADNYFFILENVNGIQVQLNQENSNNVEDNNNSITPNSEEWLTYFHSIGQLTEANHLNEWNTLQLHAFIGNAERNSINDESLPQSSFGVTEIFDFLVENTVMTHVNFMQGVKNINSNFAFVNAELNDITGLSDLNPIQNNLSLQLQINKLDNLNGLQNITSLKSLNLQINELKNLDELINLENVIEYIYIRYNPELTDISGLQNLSLSTVKVYIDDPTQYTTKVPIGSTFCNSLSNFTIDSDSYPVDYQGSKVPFSDICN